MNVNDISFRFGRRIGSPALSIACLLLATCSARADEPAAAPCQEQIREAVLRAVPIIRAAAENYPSHETCFSCHHQALPMLATVTIGGQGLPATEGLLTAQAEFTHTAFHGSRESLKRGDGIGGRAMTVGYGLWALRLADRQPNDTTEAMVTYLLKTQHEDGHWSRQMSRPPLEDSNVTCTVLAAYGMRSFAAEGQRGDVEAALSKATQWLAAATLESQEDKVSRLWGLHLLGGPCDQLQASRDAVLAAQREDGGWGQLEAMASDAYATGQTVFVLHATGLQMDHAACQRGLKFLMQTQCQDGSWLVETRSKPIQPFFDNGDPHGKSQFISISATCWAVAALASAIQAPGAAP